MYDRNVEFPNRYQLVKVAGTDDIYDVIPAPGRVDNEGTFINKNTLLKDATAALFGFNSFALPDDVLKKLSELYWHVWYRNPVVYVPGSYTTGEIEVIAVLEEATTNLTPSWEYASSFSFEESTGEFALINPSTLSFDFLHAGEANKLKGYYGKPESQKDKTKIYYFPTNTPDAFTTVEGYIYRVFMRAQELKGSPGKYPTTETEVVMSPDRNAYPDSGESGGYEYAYAGTPFNNAVTAPKIQTGSYFGTNVFGSEANANNLTFGFAPKVVWIYAQMGSSGSIQPTDSKSYNARAIIPTAALTTTYTRMKGFGANGTGTSGPDYSYGKKSADGKTISWYHDASEGVQFNGGDTYYYLAIG